jgi:hypothetical protein
MSGHCFCSAKVLWMRYYVAEDIDAFEELQYILQLSVKGPEHRYCILQSAHKQAEEKEAR